MVLCRTLAALLFKSLQLRTWIPRTPLNRRCGYLAEPAVPIVITYTPALLPCSGLLLTGKLDILLPSLLSSLGLAASYQQFQ